MDKFIIKGPCGISGTIEASGSKNAALPLIFATLLSDKEHILENVPRVQDMESALRMMIYQGCRVEQSFSRNFGADWKVDTSDLNKNEAPYDLVRKMRASFFCLGPLLARNGYAKVSLPGGCAIGARPVDLHLWAFEQLGAVIKQESGYVEIFTEGDKPLRGARFTFPKVSVGATENILMAAVKAEGTTIIENAACEPEVRYLGEALISMGAKIQGLGTPTITVEGVSELGALRYRVPGDRIEVGTYLIAAQMLHGNITIRRAPVEDLEILYEKLRESGAEVDVEADTIRCIGSKKILPVDISTEPFPGFATDLQAQWVAMMTQSEGISTVQENIFENRFMHVPELIRMGANIKISGSRLVIAGTPGKLQAAPVMATDLRASASLVLAGLSAHGETHVKRIYHLDRGYESMELKLRSLGADIERSADS